MVALISVLEDCLVTHSCTVFVGGPSIILGLVGDFNGAILDPLAELVKGENPGAYLSWIRLSGMNNPSLISFMTDFRMSIG